MKTEERSELGIKNDNIYKDFIRKSIKETFKTPEQSTKWYTTAEALCVFRGDYYALDWFERELLFLGYIRRLMPGPFPGTKITKWNIELNRPFTGLIKIEE